MKLRTVLKLKSFVFFSSALLLLQQPPLELVCRCVCCIFWVNCCKDVATAHYENIWLRRKLEELLWAVRMKKAHFHFNRVNVM